MRVFSFDVNQGSCGDLLRLGVLRRILRLLASGQCRGIFAAPPCTTYSCARKPALRSWLRPRGVDGLVGEERRRVLEANRLIDHLVIILDRASLLEVPWMVENPQSSLLWRERAFRRLRCDPQAQMVNTHLCGFGSPWRKPTSLLCCRMVAPERLRKTCSMKAPSCVCSFSGKPHITLRGRDPQGMSWTRRAQEYSPTFSRELAKIVVDSAWCREFGDRVSAAG